MEIKNRKIKLILLLLGVIVMFFCSMAVLQHAIEYMNSIPSYSNAIARNKEFAFFIAIVGMLFTLLCLIYISIKLLSNKSILTIGKCGFIDSTTMGALGFVEWRDVTHIKIDNIAGNKFIGVSVKSINDLLQNKPWCVKIIIQANMTLGYAPISINLNSAKEKPEDVVVIMNKYWDEWKKNNEKEN